MWSRHNLRSLSCWKKKRRLKSRTRHLKLTSFLASLHTGIKQLMIITKKSSWRCGRKKMGNYLQFPRVIVLLKSLQQHSPEPCKKSLKRKRKISRNQQVWLYSKISVHDPTVIKVLVALFFFPWYIGATCKLQIR